MAGVAAAIGPDYASCLTAVPADGPGQYDIRGIRTYRKPLAFHQKTVVQAFGIVAAMAEIRIRGWPNIIQVATNNDGHIALCLRRFLKIPYITYAHGNEILGLLRPGSWQPSRSALLGASRIVANSRYTAGLVARVGVPPDRIEVLYPACDFRRFESAGLSQELKTKIFGSRSRGPTILSVGGLVQRKGQDMVIRSLARIRESVADVVYLIVGEGPYRPKLESLVAELGLSDCVFFLGSVEESLLPELYAMSDVFAMVSRERIENCDVEGFGLVFLEANASGKPVLGGNSGGVPEAIKDGVSGFLVDPNSLDSITETLTRLLVNKDLAAKMGMQGRERVVREFGWDRYGKRVLDIMSSVINRDPR